MAKNGKDMLESVPTPLELVDTGADIVDQLVRTPFRVVRNVANAVGTAAGNLERDIASPAESGDIPPSPEKLVKPGINGVSHIIGGVVDIAKGAVDGVVETGRGIQKELRQVTK